MWEKVKLGDLCKLVTGKTPPTKNKEYFSDELMWLTPTDFTDKYIKKTQRGVSFFAKNERKINLIPANSLFITCIGNIGKLTINKVEACSNQQITALCPINENTNVEFLYYYLQTIQKYLSSIANNAVVPIINNGTLGEIEIPLPPLPIQEKIAEILDKADELRRKDKDLQEKYDELAQAIFIDMFGDPVKNEKGWEVKKLSELGKVDRGVSKHRPRNAPYLLNGPYPLIQTGDVANSGGWISKYKSTYSEIGLNQSKMWPSGTLCITIAANIAKTGILTFDACFPDSIVGFISNNLSNEVFIQYWFSFFQKILEEQAPESAQKNINLAILRSLEIILPPIHLQEAFAKKIEIINQLKAQTNANKSEELFQSLLQKAFNGELVS